MEKEIVSAKTLKNRKKRLRRKLKAKVARAKDVITKKGSSAEASLKVSAKRKKLNSEDVENIYHYYDNENEPMASTKNSVNVNFGVKTDRYEKGKKLKNKFRKATLPISSFKKGFHKLAENCRNSFSYSRKKLHIPLKGGAAMNSESSSSILSERCNLPVFEVREHLIEVLSKENCVIIKGETGSGKTTQIPQFIIDSGLANKGAIAVTQPRRVAAISIAERVSKERCCVLGGEVGYCVRFEDVTSPATRIKFVTDGMLLREAIGDPLLLDYSWIILDEAHERTIHTDILFGIVRYAQSIREDEKIAPLKVIVMSATIDDKKMSEYFNGSPIYEVRGWPYQIVTFNTNEEQEDYVECALRTVLQIHRGEEDGDILVFLTGEDEIGYAHSEILKAVSMLPEDEGTLELVPYVLYAALSSTEQLKALEKPLPGVRKVIFSTNIAETSITIPNIKFVVDSGMVKCRTYNAVGGLDVLKVERVSQAQANQRRGRAGREFKGYCYRLYTKTQFESFKEFAIPEIQRCSLAGVVLEIAAVGVEDVLGFDFMDKPSEENIRTAIEQLKLLEAVEGSESNLSLTSIGNMMSRFPLDPRFSKIIISSKKYKCTDEILSIIALLSVEAVFLSVSNEKDLHKAVRNKFNSSKGDHITLLNVWKGLKSAKFSQEWCIAHRINYRNVKKAAEVRQQLSKICHTVGIYPCSCGQDTEPIRRCFLTGLFMNTALLVTKKTYRGLSNNQKICIHPSSTIFHEKPICVMYTDLLETSKCYMRNVSSIDKEWLEETAPEYFRTRRLTQLQSSS